MPVKRHFVELRGNKQMKKFKNKNFLSADKIKSAYLKEAGETVYWLKGEFNQHNLFTVQISKDKQRHQAFARAVHELACYEDGKRIFEDVDLVTLMKTMDPVDLRTYGMLILGYADGDEPINAFDEETETHSKNSKKPASATKS